MIKTWTNHIDERMPIADVGTSDFEGFPSAGIGDKDIERSKIVENLLHRRLDFLSIGHY